VDLNLLPLRELALALSEMRDRRITALRTSDVGKAYEPLVLSRAHALEQYAPKGAESKPFADELDETDRRHDSYGATLFALCESMQRMPDADPAVRAIAVKVQQTFIPSLSELNGSYASEAKKALERKPKAEAMADELKGVPVPGGKSLYEITASFLECGVRLHALLSERADIAASRAPGIPGEVAALRGSTIAILNRFRAALRDELEAKPNLPRDLEAQLFSYFDQLASMRQGGKKKRSDATEPATPT